MAGRWRTFTRRSDYNDALNHALRYMERVGRLLDSAESIQITLDVFKRLPGRRQQELIAELYDLSNSALDYIDELESAVDDLDKIHANDIPADDVSLIDEMDKLFPTLTGTLLQRRQVLRSAANSLARISKDGGEAMSEMEKAYDTVGNVKKPTVDEFRRDIRRMMEQMERIDEWGKELQRDIRREYGRRR